MSTLSRAASAALVALLYYSSPAAEAVQQTPVFAATDGVLISGTFQGQPLTLLLDTGTTLSFIDVTVAGRAGGTLESQMLVRGMGPKPRVAGVLVRALRITFPYDGGEVAHDIRHVDDYARMSALIGRDVHGILGADFFRRFTVEFDWARDRVLLHPPKSFSPALNASALSMRMSIGQMPVVDVRVHLPDGKQVKARAMVDTGNGGGAIATERFQTQHRLADVLTGIDASLGEGAGGKVSGRLARLPAIDLGAFRFDDSIISLPARAPGSMSNTRDFDINIGASLLRRFSATFDYRRSRLHLVPNDRLSDAFSGVMSGMDLATAGTPHNRVIVEAVMPGSPAAQAGVQAGDEILEVNGERLGALALVDLRARLRQPDGTALTITIRRGAVRSVLPLTLRRLIEP